MAPSVQHLTSEDFYHPLGQLPHDFFNCPHCRNPIATVSLHQTYDYVANFHCKSPSCLLTNPKGIMSYICRYCAHKKKFHSFASMVHQKLPEEHIKNHEEYLRKTGEMPNKEESDDDNLEVASLGEQDTTTPQTVQQWMNQHNSSCAELPLHSALFNLSQYYPHDSLGEETPRVDHRRKPLNEHYFQLNLRQRGMGARMLAANAIYRSTHDGTVMRIHPMDSLFYVMLSQFASKLSRAQQDVFTAILDHIIQRLNQPNKQYKSLFIPTCRQDLTNYFVSGRQSIPECMPRPVPINHSLDNGFVFLRVRDILQYHLANRGTLDPLLPLEYRQGIQTLHGSSQRAEVLLKFTIAGPGGFPTEVTLWSDGFDPLATKRNRGSVHILLISIGTPQDRYHSGINTYPVWLGPADSDFTPLVRQLRDDLTSLYGGISNVNVFFNACTQKEMVLWLKVFCILQDRPERCSWLKLAYGNSNFGARFGWAGDLSGESTWKHLYSCENCYQARLNNNRGSEPKVCCADWRMEGIVYNIPTDFPKSFRCNQNPELPEDPRIRNHLQFRRLTVKDLKEACVGTFNAVCSGKWTKNEGKSYLDTFAVSPSLRDEICSQANNGESPMPELPASWSMPGVDVCDHIDVPMHLCFLGITKANSKDLIGGWLKRQKKAKSFLDKSQSILREIKSLCLSWCNIEIEFGGYVSENYIAYGRCYKYIYQLLRNLEIRDHVPYVDPPKPLSEYNLTEKRSWLIARGFQGINRRSTGAVVAPIFDVFTAPNAIIPPIVETVASRATIEETECLIYSWHVLISRIMSVNKNPTEEGGEVADIERHVKLFLSSVEKFDSSRRTDQRRREVDSERANPKRRKTMPIIPIWKQKPNYLGLLNYPATLERFGPIRELTELDAKGEGFIKHMKGRIPMGLHANWAYNAMLSYYKSRSYQYVLRDCLWDVHQSMSHNLDDSGLVMAASRIANDDTELVDEMDVDGDRSQDKKYKAWDMYRTQEEGMVSLLRRKPISGMVWSERFFLVVGTSGNIQSLLEIAPQNFVKRVCGADYFSWTMMDQPVPPDFVKETEKESFLLLPLQATGDDGDEALPFYLITSEWREVIHVESPDHATTSVLGLPRIPSAVYHK